MLKKFKETCLLALFASLTIFDSNAHANNIRSYSVIKDENLNHYFQSIAITYNYLNTNRGANNDNLNFFFLSSDDYLLNGNINIKSLKNIFPNLNENNLLDDTSNLADNNCIILNLDGNDEDTFIIALNEPSAPADQNDYSCALLSLLSFDGVDISNYTNKPLRDVMKKYFEVMGRK